MKINITILIILVCAFCTFAQNSPYVNEQYNFSFIPPSGAKENPQKGYIVSYFCPPPECKVTGVFGLNEINPIDKTTTVEATKFLQSKALLYANADAVLSNMPAESKTSILEKKFTPYKGRPAQRIDYKFKIGDINFNAFIVVMYMVEKQSLVTFSCFTKDTESIEWNKICDQSINSFTAPAKKSPGEGIRTVIKGADNINSSPKTINGGIINGKAIKLPVPEYPAAAKAIRAEGVVNIQVVIDEEGNVLSANAVSGHPLLREASEKAALLAKFKPTVLSGQKVKVKGVIVYNFNP